MTIATDQTKDAYIKELEGKLQDHGHEQYIMPFQLTQQQAKLLALLMEHPVCSAHTLQTRVKMSTEAKVAVHRLRKQMDKHGVKINAKRFYGFWLDDEAKTKVRELMA